MHVIISDEARADLADIFDFHAQFSSNESARDLLLQIIDAALTLSNFPRRHPVVPGLEDLEARRLLTREWAVLYRVLPTHVEVTRVVRASWDVRASLESRDQTDSDR